MPSASTSHVGVAPERVKAWLARHPRRVSAALLGGALFVRLICLQVGGGPLPRIHAFVVDSDNHFFHEWGRRVAQGEWIQRGPLHPMTVWMRQVAGDALARDPRLPVTLGLAPDLRYDRPAMEEKLWDRWLGGATFYQSPPIRT
jgi:hypothetical protein